VCTTSRRGAGIGMAFQFGTKGRGRDRPAALSGRSDEWLKGEFGRHEDRLPLSG